MNITFRDKMFSSGTTDMLTESGEYAGKLDLKSAFSSSVDIYDSKNNLVHGGKFQGFSNRWSVYASGGGELGVLRARFSFKSKKFEYDAFGRGVYTITSPVFSKEYDIIDSSGTVVAHFKRISSGFQPGTYTLINVNSLFNSYELVTVIMGVHEIQKRNDAAVTTVTTT